MGANLTLENVEKAPINFKPAKLTGINYEIIYSEFRDVATPIALFVQNRVKEVNKIQNIGLIDVGTSSRIVF